jgi:ribosomal-protein-alanine N-acetyltransferase
MPAEPAKSTRFTEIPAAAMWLLLDDDLTGAGAIVGIPLIEFFVSERAKRLWRRRLAQMTADPRSVRWIVRAGVSEPGGHVIGYAGFHGPPDSVGMVEVGYAVAPECRRQGYAKAMLAALIDRARQEKGVRMVRASIRPDNTGSLGTIAGFGFAHVGELMDDEDGLEYLFELRLD